MECLGLHNKPKAEVHLGHKLTGPKEVEVEVVAPDNTSYSAYVQDSLQSL
jgi:hypothetical protein